VKDLERSWSLEIKKVCDGFILIRNGDLESVISLLDDEDLDGQEALLYSVLEHFCLSQDRRVKERIHIIREVGEKYILGPGEMLKKHEYFTVSTEKEKPGVILG